MSSSHEEPSKLFSRMTRCTNNMGLDWLGWESIRAPKNSPPADVTPRGGSIELSPRRALPEKVNPSVDLV